jgi:hypothetical protein
MKLTEILGELPQDLRAAAIRLADNVAWPPSAAIAVIGYLVSHRIAVLGTETWVPCGDAPRVVGWSEYIVADSSDWDTYVRTNAELALKEVTSHLPEDALLNLTCSLPRPE